MDPRLRYGLATAFLVVVGGLVAHTIIPTQVAQGRHIRIPWDGGAPVGSLCYELDGLSDPAARALFGLDPDGGQQYARIRMGAVLGPDGGEAPSLPGGMLALDDSVVTLDGGACPYALEAWLPATDAPFPCACSTGSNCQWRQPDGGTVACPLGVTMQPGTFSGSGAFPKVCVELEGFTSWPSECPP